jgi:hypothetical protein
MSCGSTPIPKCNATKIPTFSEAANTPYNYNVAGPELALQDQYAQEHVRNVGTPLNYYILSRTGSQEENTGTQLDPLYSEPTRRDFSDPYKIFAHINWPQTNFETRDDGTHIIIITNMWIARKELEDAGVKHPQPGDVVHFWDLPYFNLLAANDREVEGAGMYFDVLEVRTDGHLFDTPYFTGYKIDIKRRTEFGAERKLGEI